MKRNLWTKIEQELLINLYPTSTEKQLTESFSNRSYDSIKLKAAKLGIKKQLGFKSEANLSPLLDNSHESYYWIGFLMADGYINHKTNRLKLSLGKEDFEHVYKFSKFIKCNNVREYEIKIGEKGYGRDLKKICEISVQDNLLIPKIIKKYDFKPRKTYNPPNLYFLKSDFDLFCSFLIGFIDADGSINVNENKKNTCITIRCHNSWGSNLEFMQNLLLNKLGFDFIPVKFYRKDKLATIYFNNFEIIKFLKLKQKELSLPVIERKWNKIDETIFTRNEIYKLNLVKIKKLMKNENLSIKEISKIVNLSYSRTHKIINNLKNE